MRAADVERAEFEASVNVLVAKLERFAPRIACFHGITAYRHVHRFISAVDSKVALGLQDVRVGFTRVFVVPNPSGANAHFTPAQQVQWYDRLAQCRESLALAPAQQ